MAAEVGVERARDLRRSAPVGDNRTLVTEGFDESFEVLVAVVVSVEVAG